MGGWSWEETPKWQCPPVGPSLPRGTEPTEYSLAPQAFPRVHLAQEGGGCRASAPSRYPSTLNWQALTAQGLPGQSFSTRGDFVSQETFSSLMIFLVVATQGMLLASRGWKPGMLLHTLPCSGQASMTKKCVVPGVSFVAAETLL